MASHSTLAANPMSGGGYGLPSLEVAEVGRLKPLAAAAAAGGQCVSDLILLLGILQLNHPSLTVVLVDLFFTVFQKSLCLEIRR